MFKKILIANRGEIACRVIQTCQRLGIQTVAVYSDADRQAQHVRLATEAYHIGPAAPAESYLDIDKLINIAQQSGAEAVHPGYGFLSENPTFARRLKSAGIQLIGPSPETMEKMGSKADAKQTMREAGVPVVPGYDEANQDTQHLHMQADEIGYPLMLKATAGGGGKGMRIVRRSDEFVEQLAAAQRESKNAFGDHRMLIERYLENPRHIEVQVVGDGHGHAVHLFERDCSSQRRYQKVIEEAPAPTLETDVATAMHKAAVQAAKAVKYAGAGTVEFIVSGNDFYFMEMNTRLQVEHPVTEMITGVDLVEWQLKVAAGEPIPLPQDKIKQRGHALEARLYAEDPNTGFLPSSGLLEHLTFPQASTSLRVETGVAQGDTVTVHYDPMIAKLVVWGEDRNIALQRLNQALSSTSIGGLKSNVDFLQQLTNHDVFVSNAIHTAWLDRHLDDLLAEQPKAPPTELIYLAAGLFIICGCDQPANNLDNHSPWSNTDGWRNGYAGRQDILIGCDNDQFTVHVWQLPNKQFKMQLKGDDQSIIANPPQLFGSGDLGHANIELADRKIEAQVHCQPTDMELIHDNRRWCFERLSIFANIGVTDTAENTIAAPMPGKIISVNVEIGDNVTEGQTLVVMEAMKMEMSLKAPFTGQVERINVKAIEFVEAGVDCVELTLIETE